MQDLLTPGIEPVKPKRSTFLTVLCILTFIGSGWGIFGGISSYFTASAAAGVAQAAMDDAREKIEESGSSDTGSKMAEKVLAGVSDMYTPDNLKKNALFSIVASVFTLLGAILMFGLKKTGYWIYILGTLIGIIAPFVVFGGSNLITIITSSGVAFIGIIFVVLYGMNVKHMQ